MSRIVQTSKQIKTTGSASATATFGKPLTAGNVILAAVMAVDSGAAAGPWRAFQSYQVGTLTKDSNGNYQQVISGGLSGASAPTWNATLNGTTNDGDPSTGVTWENIGTSAVSYLQVDNSPPLFGSVSDTQGNSYRTAGAAATIFGDGTRSLWLGIFYANPTIGDALPGGANAVTFNFTPFSSSSNCQVGIVAFEVEGLLNGFFADTAHSPSTTPTTFSPTLQGNLTYSASAHGYLLIVAGAEFTTDGVLMTGGSGVDPSDWTLNGVGGALLNSVHSNLAAQSVFVTDTGNNFAGWHGLFGSSTLESELIACASVGVALQLASDFSGNNGGDFSVHDGSGEPFTRNDCEPGDGLTITFLKDCPASGPFDGEEGKAGDVKKFSASVARELVTKGFAQFTY